MQKTFIEDLEIVRNNRAKDLVKLEQAMKKISSHVCRGEVSLVDKRNKVPILQTHYEYFKVIIVDGFVKLDRCNLKGEEFLDYTMINNVKITRYLASETNMVLEGDLNENLKLHILIVFKDKILK